MSIPPYYLIDTNDDTARTAAPPPVIEIFSYLDENIYLDHKSEDHCSTNLKVDLNNKLYVFSLELGIKCIYLAFGIS